jgi:hypothetical protein
MYTCVDASIYTYMYTYIHIYICMCCAGNSTAGLDVSGACVGDMWALGIREAYKSKLQVSQ